MFPGDPLAGAFWSELNTDSTGSANDPADRSFMMASGPFTMQPGDEEEIVFAIVWSRGEDHLDAVRVLRRHVAAVHGIADALLTPDSSLLPEAPVPQLGLTRNHPNPFSAETTIAYSVPVSVPVQLTVHDVLGREVARLVDAAQAPGSYQVPFQAGRLADGVYFYRLAIGSSEVVRAMVLAR